MQRPPPADRRPYLAPLPEAPAPAPAAAAQRSAEDLRSFFRSLTLPDRWATGATLVLLISLGLPWRWTRQDDELIGLVAAWPVALLGAAVLTIIYVRASRANATLDRRLRLAQVAAAAMAALTTGIFLPWATQTKALHGAGRTVAIALSTPQAGAYLGLLAAAAAFLASLPNLRDA